METMQWTTIDKSEWPRGAWDEEPDKMQWQDEATGLPCLIVRGPSGALCGYVGVSEGHPWFGKDYNDCHRVGDEYVDVHGGLTFADFCADTNDHSRHICHIPGEGEPERVWWLGFDCAHSVDWCPAHGRLGYPFTMSPHETYKALGYVERQVELLAHQAKHEARA